MAVALSLHLLAPNLTLAVGVAVRAEGKVLVNLPLTVHGRLQRVHLVRGRGGFRV